MLRFLDLKTTVAPSKYWSVPFKTRVLISGRKTVNKSLNHKNYVYFILVIITLTITVTIT